MWVSNREANGLNGRKSEMIDSPKNLQQTAGASQIRECPTAEWRVCLRGNLVARGNWTEICPFANQKPLPYFPNASVDGSFSAVRGCSRAVLDRSPIRRQFARFINRRVPNGRELASRLFCRRHFANVPARNAHATVGTTSGTGAGQLMHSIQAEREPHAASASIGIRSQSDFGAGGMNEPCSVFCATQDRQSDGEPLWRTPQTTS
jgi:hypothetical protein